ncbi:hypothetical protein L1049_012621 [Liquidambar formosana]|uniref:Uncharacterized protein n=1 Tax=Liquidambar formosana TaxID=63359 RepID=A0AAP0N6S2_LIQFO
MASPSPLAFTVRRHDPEMVVPEKPTPREQKQLSDIDDQEGTRYQLPVMMFYEGNPTMKGKDPAKVIREALAKALVFYYPLAGRLVEGPNRKLIVECTGEGVLFVEAEADITLKQLGDAILPPCPCSEELLHDVPGSEGILGCPLVLIQVTRLTCGGFILAIRLNHTMADAFGLVQFLTAIGEIARGAWAPSVPPLWERELLTARSPPRITCPHHEYEEAVDEKCPPTLTMGQNNMIQQSFFFGPKEVKTLREQLPPQLRTCSTKFELITACVWKCRTTALELHPDEIIRLSCANNVRGKDGFRVPIGYYGNAFAFPAVLSKAEMLCRNPLGYAVELVREAKAQLSEEYMRSLMDFMVLKGRPMYNTGWNHIVTDNSRIGYEKVDFGWGKLQLGAPTAASHLISYFSRFTNTKGEEGIVVPMCLPLPVMGRFQQELEKMTR